LLPKNTEIAEVLADGNMNKEKRKLVASYSPPLETFLKEGFKLVPDYRFVNILSEDHIFVLTVGDGHQIKELPFPAEPPFTQKIVEIAHMGFRGFLIVAPLRKQSEILIYIRPAGDDGSFFSRTGLTPEHPSEMFSFIARDIDRGIVQHGEEKELLDALLHKAKVDRDTIIGSVFRVDSTASEDVEIWNVAPGETREIAPSRPYLRYTIKKRIVEYYGRIPSHTTLITAHEKENNLLYLFNFSENQEKIYKDLLTPDELFFSMTVQVREGSNQLEVKKLAEQLSEIVPFTVRNSEFQTLVFTRVIKFSKQVDPDGLRKIWQKQIHDALLFLVMEIGVGFAEIIPANVRRCKRGFLSDYVTVGPITNIPRLSVDVLNKVKHAVTDGIPDQARRLLAGANGSIIAFSSRDSLLSAWAATEELFFFASDQSSLVGGETLETIRGQLRTIDGLEEETINRIIDRIREMKSPTRNQVCAKKWGQISILDICQYIFWPERHQSTF
jgi:hypothetical protein